MKTRVVYKDAFSVIGKKGQGPAANPGEWISPLWEDANAHFPEISALVCHSENGGIAGVWGAMKDAQEQNKRWDESGKYMAGCEADTDAQPPKGWAKWTIPAQTYLVADCTLDNYGEVFGKIISEENSNIIGTVQERYPEPGNSNKIELYFPIAAGMLFCQSCAMPMTKPEDFGTEADGSTSRDYCGYCYKKGVFETADTMEQVIEDCIPFCMEAGVYKDVETARADMLSFFPKLKRWAKP